MKGDRWTAAAAAAGFVCGVAAVTAWNAWVDMKQERRAKKKLLDATLNKVREMEKDDPKRAGDFYMQVARECGTDCVVDDLVRIVSARIGRDVKTEAS